VAAQRAVLADLRRSGTIAEDVFHRIEEELDWVELAATRRTVSPSTSPEVPRSFACVCKRLFQDSCKAWLPQRSGYCQQTLVS